MLRPLWTGQIQVSLVAFGVKLFPATNAKSEIHFQTSRESRLVSMATTLSGSLSDTGSCLICPRLTLAAIFGQPRQNFQEIIRSFSMAACFAAPIA